MEKVKNALKLAAERMSMGDPFDRHAYYAIQEALAELEQALHYATQAARYEADMSACSIGCIKEYSMTLLGTKDIIEIAKECGAHYYLDTFEQPCICFIPPELQQFAQRIEAPHLQRIVELEKQVKQLREALLKAATELTKSGWNCGNLFDEIDKALEASK